MRNGERRKIAALSIKGDSPIQRDQRSPVVQSTVEQGQLGISASLSLTLSAHPG